MIAQKKKPTKRALEAQQTRKKLYNIATELVSQYGYSVVTIDDITKAANVSKGTFYTHFKSKEEVFLEYFNKIDEAYIKAFENLDPSTSAAEQLYLFIDTMMDYCQNVCGVDIMRVVYMDQISTSPSKMIVNNKSRTLYRKVSEIVNHGYKTGEFKKNLAHDTLVETIIQFARSLIYDWCLYRGEIDLIEHSRCFFKEVVNWLSLS